MLAVNHPRYRPQSTTLVIALDASSYLACEILPTGYKTMPISKVLPCLVFGLGEPVFGQYGPAGQIRRPLVGWGVACEELGQPEPLGGGQLLHQLGNLLKRERKQIIGGWVRIPLGGHLTKLINGGHFSTSRRNKACLVPTNWMGVASGSGALSLATPGGWQAGVGAPGAWAGAGNLAWRSRTGLPVPAHARERTRTLEDAAPP